MDAQGWRGYGGLAIEGSYNTFVPATDFVDMNSEGLTINDGWTTLRTLNNSRWPYKRYQGNFTAEGPLNFPVNPDDVIGMILKDLMGAETYTALESGTVGQHAFIPQNALGTPGLSAEISRDASLVGNVWKFSGGHVRKLTLSGEAGGPLIATADFVFANGIPGATAQTPSYSTRVPLLWHTGYVTFDALDVDLDSLTLEIMPGLRDKKHVLFSRYINEPTPGPFGVSGSFGKKLPDLAEYDRYKAGSPAAIDVLFRADTVGATSLGLRIAMQTVYWNTWTAPAASEAEIQEQIGFESLNSDAASLLTLTLTNSVTGAY
jgi:hypothetical protein